MDHDSPVVADVPEVTLNWASPITLDEDLNAGRTVTTLMESTDKSWTTTDTNIQPNQEAFGDIGFEVDEETQQSYPLAVAVQGQFQSYFTDKPTPFEAEAADASTAADANATATTPEAEPTVNPVETLGKLETSPESARLVVFGSSEFLNDNIFRLESSLTQDRALSNLQLAQNAVSWFVEDTSLSNLRAHSSAARILDPMTDSDQSRWEILNYVLALISLGAIGVIWRLRKRGEKPMALASVDNTVYTHSTPNQPVGAHSLQGGK
jgi:ABC-2 type transport system permease protein